MGGFTYGFCVCVDEGVGEDGEGISMNLDSLWGQKRKYDDALLENCQDRTSVQGGRQMEDVVYV